jgi:hypothetical protein
VTAALREAVAAGARAVASVEEVGSNTSSHRTQRIRT